MPKIINRIMTTRELADYIKLNEKTVLKMAQEGKLPGVKIGSQWRFHVDSIDAYFQNDILKTKTEDLDLIINAGINDVPLSRLISRELICLDLKSTEINDVLAELTGIAVKAGKTTESERLLEELVNREKMLSTAIGEGVAIPHPRHPSSEFFQRPNIIFARSAKGVNFASPDNQPVYLFFMTCAQNEFVHLRLLAKISKLLHEHGIRAALRNARSEDEIVQMLLSVERKNFLKNV